MRPSDKILALPEVPEHGAYGLARNRDFIHGKLCAIGGGLSGSTALLAGLYHGITSLPLDTGTAGDGVASLVMTAIGLALLGFGWRELSNGRKIVAQERRRLAEADRRGELPWLLNVLSHWRLMYRDRLVNAETYISEIDNWVVKISISPVISKRRHIAPVATFSVSSTDDAGSKTEWLTGSMSANWESNWRIDDMLSRSYHQHVTSLEDQNVIGRILAKGIEQIYRRVEEDAGTSFVRARHELLEGRKVAEAIEIPAIGGGNEISVTRALGRLSARAHAIEEDRLGLAAATLARNISGANELDAATAGLLDYLLPRSEKLLERMEPLHAESRDDEAAKQIRTALRKTAKLLEDYSRLVVEANRISLDLDILPIESAEMISA